VFAAAASTESLFINVSCIYMHLYIEREDERETDSIALCRERICYVYRNLFREMTSSTCELSDDSLSVYVYVILYTFEYK